MTESLYIIIEPTKRGWRSVRISKVSKKRPVLKRPSEQALIRLEIAIPDNVLQPRVVRVEVRPEHIVQPTATVTSQPAR